MSSDIKPNVLGKLDACVDALASDIGSYTKKPGDFTRNRKLNAATTIKVTLNMQGNSLNAELLYKQYKETRSKSTKDQRWDFGTRCKIKFRVVKFRINDDSSGKEEWEVLITNLNRFEFPISRMKELYHMRWDIETSFRELKYALGGVQFHSKKDDFIQMELYAHFIMFNAVSRSINCVSVPQANHKYPYNIDFKMACHVVRKYYRLHNNEPPDKMFAEMLSYINPVREGRSDKRNMKPKSAMWFIYRVA